MINYNQLASVFEAPKYFKLSFNKRYIITGMLEELLKEIIACIEPDFFLEIGAFEAAFSVELKKLYPNHHFLALEANPLVFENFKSSVIDSGIDYRNLAATSQRKDIEIHIPEVVAGNSMPKIGRMGSLNELAIQNSRTRAVPVQGIPLDDLLQEFTFQHAAIWIDVEGHLSEVLSGANELLKHCSIVFAEMETSPVWEGQILAPEIINQMDKYGFSLVARDCQKAFQYNGLFLSKHLILDYPNISLLVQEYFEISFKKFTELAASELAD